MTILDAMREFFWQWFAGPSWAAWRDGFLAALFALPLDPGALEIYRRHTDRTTPPTAPAKEGWVVVGRRGGKSRIAALVAVYLACFRSYKDLLAPGEVGTIALIAADRKQSRTLMRYVVGFIEAVPMLAQMKVASTKESITLSNRIVIEVHTASWRTLRGYTLVAAICDELAFWRSEDTTNPDAEILTALRPAMATVPSALLLVISSPYASRGELWRMYRAHYGKDGPILVWQADTASMNPSVDPQVIAEAYAADPTSAAAEYGAQFRRDIEAFISRDAVEANVIEDRHELPPVPDRFEYRAFVDPSGGSADSMTLAIAHQHKLSGQAVLDVVRERKPPFSPAAVVKEFAGTLKQYGVSVVTGDRYAGEWPRERFREHGITYKVSEYTKSELFLELLPLINSAQVELLDAPKLLHQLCALERRTSRAGKDSIDHHPGGHDDVANAAAGALVGAHQPEGGLSSGLQSGAGYRRRPGAITNPSHPFYWATRRRRRATRVW